MLSFFSGLFVQPLIFVFGLIFTAVGLVTNNVVISVVFLGLFVNLVSSPLYRKAEEVSAKQRSLALDMKPYVDHIKSVYSGDEQFMVLSAYYRIRGYHPWYILKESFPLLLQVPFFIAAYMYLSGSAKLQGASFLWIKDLSKPDAMFWIGSFRVNILPVIMTAVNFLSGYIYSKEGSRQQKIQIYVLGILFLILLYDSPSGIVLYWIVNNLFSLARNIYERYPSRLRPFVPVALVLSFVFPLVYGCCTRSEVLFSMDSTAFLPTVCLLALSCAVLLKEAHPRLPAFVKKIGSRFDAVSTERQFLFALCLEFVLAVFFGWFIPASVVSSSVGDFVDVEAKAVPGYIFEYPFVVHFGLFLLWGTVFYLAFGENGRRRMLFALSLLAGVAMVNHFLFDPEMGTIHPDLTAESVYFLFSTVRHVLNWLCIIFVFVLFWLLFVRNIQYFRVFFTVSAAALTIVSSIFTVRIARQQGNMSSKMTDAQQMPDITLSKTGKNVVVVMLDRAIGDMFPYILDSRPELNKSLSGFTYYPHTVSFGYSTKFAAPALFGGYEYMPLEMNRRKDEKLVDKHNEALKVLPSMFAREGYLSQVYNTSLANYEYWYDMSIYDDCEGVKAYSLAKLSDDTIEDASAVAAKQAHNFAMYGIFRAVPLCLKSNVYLKGRYFGEKTSCFSSMFIGSYAQLKSLPDMTKVSSAGKGSFVMMTNELAHSEDIVNISSFDPHDEVDPDTSLDNRALGGRTLYFHRIGTNSKSNMTPSSGRLGVPCPYFDEELVLAHWCVNTMSYLLLADWFDYLKKEGVYDNTRIIIVSDHGRAMDLFDDLIDGERSYPESVRPVLLVKDFGAKGSVTFDKSFMTNADTPSIAISGLLEDTTNPFTKKPVTSEAKSGSLYMTQSWNWHVENTSGSVFDTSDKPWWCLTDENFSWRAWRTVSDDDMMAMCEDAG